MFAFIILDSIYSVLRLSALEEEKMSDNKYKLFRNYMVNELGISCEDIKEWTMQAVEETVEKILCGLDLKGIVKELAWQKVRNSYTSQNALENAFVEVVKTAMQEQFRLSIEVRKPDETSND